MSLSLHTLAIRTFASVEAKNLDGTMRLFAEDAVVIDPHFRDPRIEGKAAITRRIPGAISSIAFALGFCDSEQLFEEDDRRRQFLAGSHVRYQSTLSMNFNCTSPVSNR